MQNALASRRPSTHGGLIAKAGLIALTDDDRTVLYGAMLDAAAVLRGDDRERVLLLWRRAGKRAFEADAAAAKHPEDYRL